MLVDAASGIVIRQELHVEELVDVLENWHQAGLKVCVHRSAERTNKLATIMPAASKS